MKILMFCGLFALSASAQLGAQTTNSTHLSEINRRVATMLQAQEAKKHFIPAAERTTSVAAERLIGRSIYDFYPQDSIMGLSDTTRFFYSGTVRGSQFNYSSLSYNIDPVYGPYDYGYGRTINTLSGGITTKASPNYFAQVLSDSSRQYSYWSGDTAGHHFIGCDTLNTYETYDGNSNVLSIDYRRESLDLDATFYTWDARNNNIYSLNLRYYPAYDSNSATFSLFNTSGQLVEDSIAYGPPLRPAARMMYTYDGLGNLIHVSDYSDSMGTWLEYYRWDLTYNSDNFINKDSFSLRQFGTHTWVTDRVDSFGYTTGVNYFTYHRMNFYNDSTYPIVVGTDIRSKHVNSAGLPDTLYWSATGYYTANLLHPIYKQALTYDSYRNPVMAYEFHYDLTDTSTGAGYYNASPDIITHYYYENYLSSAGISNVNPATRAEVIFQPNPSTGVYKLTISNKTPQMRVVVCNELGRVVYEQTFTGNTTQVDISTLQGGIYIARVFDDSNHVMSTNKLVKMQ